ncbi:MAG: amino acid aminotransferase [Chlamydiota bacterium]
MFFEKVEEAPVDAIFGLGTAFYADPRTTKVNLSVGIYKSADLKTPILKSVKDAEQLLITEEETKDYLPIEGHKEYLQRTGALVFGEEFWNKHKGRIAAVQSIGGTGALRLGGDFLRKETSDTAYISDPTWPNHKGVFLKCGFKVESYPYYDKVGEKVDFERLIGFLEKLSPKSIVILHACCHNPTGADLTLEQWKMISDLFFAKKLFPFFDFAYQGFDLGFEEDARAVRLFANEGHEMLIASSYSKNFTLYSERVGALFVLTDSEKTTKNVLSQLKILVRTNYSNPPRHGAAIVSMILGRPELKKEWEAEIAHFRARIAEMRNVFVRALTAKNPRFQFLEDRRGLFSFCGLEKAQVERLVKEFGIYMTLDGRINIAGLTPGNMDYVINAIVTVL